MTIEQKIKTLLELYHFIKGDIHFCGYNEENATQSLETAIETMSKYQMIEEIVKSWKDGMIKEKDSIYAFHEIIKVVTKWQD